jgi:uncharacterized phage protein (TIGR01671 family)
MRKIKFRAWHTTQNKMFSADNLGQDELTLAVDGRGFVNVHGTTRALSQYYSSMIPEQFTGLYDKNMNEIYEGDIVNIITSDDCLIVETGFIAEVCWDDSDTGFFYQTNDGTTPYIKTWFVKEVTILGNIHENPEMLKEK